MLNDVLFELGCEELPSGSVWPLADALVRQVSTALDKAQLVYDSTQCFATPRRIAFRIKGLVAQQPSQTIARRGPAKAAAYDANGQPTPALLGFARSCGVEWEDLSFVETPQGSWVMYEAVQEGVLTTSLLPEIINQALASLPIPKPMRWGSGNVEFARPVHWVVLIYGESIIKTTILGLTTDRISHGHRFHHPEAIEIKSPSTYEEQMLAAYVCVNFADRKGIIIEQVRALASKVNAQAVMPESLLDEVTSIVEWPQALMANFEKTFLEVPSEALIASMQSHQKCFALQDAQGKLLPHFITVSNIKSTNTNQVITGNEKVMRARLSDASFFFNLDRKEPLSSRIPATEKVIFQHRLGSLQDKSLRLSHMMQYLTHEFGLNLEQATRAALLSKCDLLTGMVGEFPDLQGLMGYYYATHDGEDQAVALSLKEQYLPRFAADILPQSDLGLALSLADRIDTLVGIFAIGQKPSGVKDPFKLRRHALAVVRLLLTTAAPIQLSVLIKKACSYFGAVLPAENDAFTELKPFLLERLLSLYQSQDISSDMVLAVRAKQDEWLFDFDKRIQALAVFVKKPESISLSAACKRVNNLLQHASVEEGPAAIQEHLLTNPAEIALYHQLQTLEKTVGSLYETGDYQTILTHLASLREPVDAFFDKVMVMVDDTELKANRIQLLTRLQGLLQGVADISLLTHA